MRCIKIFFHKVYLLIILPLISSIQLAEKFTPTDGNLLQKTNYNKNIVKRTLPEENLIISYCGVNEMDTKIIESASNGSNVIIWFKLRLLNVNNKPTIIHKLDFKKVSEIVKEIKNKQPQKKVTHMILVGGWNTPHVSTDFTAEEWALALHDWNTKEVPSQGFESGFDGFDFNLEGDDDPKSENAKFTKKLVDLVGQLCQQLKSFGYITSLVPPQSYFDVDESHFSLSLNFNPSWKDPGSFPYAGKNAYAYFWKRYYYLSPNLLKKYNANFGELNNSVETYDFLSIQLYEGYSRANYLLRDKKASIPDYFIYLVSQLSKGWLVKFSDVEEVHYEDAFVSIPLNKLIIGLSNGWTNDFDKYLFLWEDELKIMFESLKVRNLIPRGFMYWTISGEGNEVTDKSGQKRKYFMSKILADLYNENE